MSDLAIPESWATTPLSNLLKAGLTYGVLKPGKVSSDGVPMLKIEKICGMDTRIVKTFR
jgi:hypothetical protein